jgi:hypothetical protein
VCKSVIFLVINSDSKFVQSVFLLIDSWIEKKTGKSSKKCSR